MRAESVSARRVGKGGSKGRVQGLGYQMKRKEKGIPVGQVLLKGWGLRIPSLTLLLGLSPAFGEQHRQAVLPPSVTTLDGLLLLRHESSSTAGFSRTVPSLPKQRCVGICFTGSLACWL